MSRSNVELRPYVWQGPYAQWRGDAPHDPGLCADVRAPWMAGGERLIIRACEVIGHPGAFFYDDHFPQSEPQGRGALYQHKDFRWDASGAPGVLRADCTVEKQGQFTLELRGQHDFVDIQLGMTNATDAPIGPIDWSFCVIALESPTLRNPEHDRFFIVREGRLLSLRQLTGGAKMAIHPVRGAGGFVPVGHAMLPRGSAEAEQSFVALESSDGRFSTALGFEHSYSIYGCTGNMCFHADPWFGTIEPGGHKLVCGRLYLIEGSAEAALGRYRSDFSG